MLGLPVSGLSLELRNFAMYQSQIARAETMTRAMGDATASVVTHGQRMARVLGTVGIALGAVGIAAAAALIPILKTSASLERQILMGTGAAKAMRISTEALEAERAELGRLDVARSSSYETLNGLILQNVDFAKSSDLVSAALDMAAFRGMKQERVLIDYALAVENANVSTLRQYGISAQSNAIFAVQARALGKVASELTQVEKRTAILNYVLTVSQRIQGAYTASLRTVEGQLRRTSMLFQQVKESVGEALGPTVLAALKSINRLAESFLALPPPVKAAVGYVLTLVAGLGLLAGALTVIMPGLKILYVAIKQLPGLLTGTSTALAAASGGAKKLGILALGASGRVAGLVKAIVTIHPAIAAAIAVIAFLGIAIAKNFGGLGDLVKKVAQDVGRSLTVIWADLKTWGTASYELIRDVLVKPFQWADAQIRKITGRLAQQDYGFKFDVARFFLGGARIMAGFALGILQGINTYVLPTIIGMLNQISKYLIGSSPPPEGPLSKINIGGVKIIQAWLQGMSSVSLETVYRIVEEVEGALTRALWLVQDTLFDIETQERRLDRALWPLEDSLARVKAATDLISIPMERQKRALEGQLEIIRLIAEVERTAAEARLRELEQQTAQFQLMVDADRDRLEILDHEIFMEQMRTKIMRQVTSARLITMQSASRVLADQVAIEEESLQASKDAESAERDWLSVLVTAAEAQMAAIEGQISRLEHLIALEAERVTWSEEEIRLLKATQIESRLAALEERRFWEEEERQILHLLDILGRVPAQLKAKAARAMKDIAGVLEDWESEMLGAFELPEISLEVDRTAIENAKRQLAAIFAPVEEEWKKTQALWQELTFEWKELVIVVKMEWEKDPQALLKEVDDILIMLAKSSFKRVNEWGKVMDTGVNAWSTQTRETVKIWSDKVNTKINAWATSTGDEIDLWAGRTGKAIGKWAATTNKSIVSWSKESMGTLTVWAQKATVAVMSFIEESIKKIPARLDAFMAVIDSWAELTGIPGVIRQGKALAENLIEAARQAISDKATKIHEIGESIVDGIKKGIKNEWGDFKDWLVGKAKDIIKTIEKALKVGSAARTTVPVGVSLVEGIQEGFEAEMQQLLRYVQPKVQLVIDRMMEPVRGMGTAGSVTNYYSYATQGPTISVDAQYGQPQSPASIRDDIGLMLAVAG